MWTARIFAGIALSGITFLLWFLVQLLREQPFRPRRIRLTYPDRAAIKPLQLRREAVKNEDDPVTLHWRYRVGQPDRG